MRKGDLVLHEDKSLGLGEVLEVSADDALISFHDPVSGARKTGLYPLRRLRVHEPTFAVPKPDGKLVLGTRNSRRDRTGDIKQCAECRECRSGLWKFTGTSWGTVHLCDHCKAKAMDRKYGPIDVLPGALPGGRWESKR